MAMDRGVGADLEVGPAELVFGLFVALFNPVPDAVDPQAFTCFGSHWDPGKKKCSRCTTAYCAPLPTRPADAVSVLFRPTAPVATSGTPGTRRCARDPNKPLSWAA